MRLPIFALLLCLGACHGANLDGAPLAAGALPSELHGRITGQARTCVSIAPNQNARVIDPATIAYDSGATIWINRLRAACPGLSPYNVMIVERGNGAQLCRGDRVRGLEPGGTIPGASCNLQDWVPYRRP